MNTYLHGEIIPGERVGDFKIGFTLEGLLKHINFEYRIENNEYGVIVSDIGHNIHFYLTDKDYLQQISLIKNFQGEFLDKIGIGDKLANFKHELKYETSEYSDGFYSFPDYEGIHMYLDDRIEEAISPIICILIFDKNLGTVEYVDSANI